jgi:hypothetical protein
MIYTQADLNDVDIVTLDAYHKYWTIFREVRNPHFDGRSSDLLNFKKGEAPVIAKFYNRLNALLIDADFAVCYVPSCTAYKVETPVLQLAQMLTGHSKRLDATGCIVRHTTIPKLATGGDRSMSVHLNSLRIENSALIKGKQVLLLDDITTTHNSLRACAQLLVGAGAAKVYCLALGQTVAE